MLRLETPGGGAQSRTDHAVRRGGAPLATAAPLTAAAVDCVPHAQLWLKSLHLLLCFRPAVQTQPPNHTASLTSALYSGSGAAAGAGGCVEPSRRISNYRPDAHDSAVWPLWSFRRTNNGTIHHCLVTIVRSTRFIWLVHLMGGAVDGWCS